MTLLYHSLGYVFVTYTFESDITILYYSEISKARTIINRTNHAVVLYNGGYFTEIINTIRMQDEKKEVRDSMALGEGAHQRILDGYRSLPKANRNITYIYSGYENCLMMINDYIPLAGFAPTTRPWYQSAIAKTVLYLK